MSTLTNLSREATVVGEAYWFFLRSLGYTNANQVPPKCIIPAPNLLLSSNVPPNVLASGNFTEIYNAYIFALQGVAQDFGVDTFTNATFCGQQWPGPLSNVTTPFGTYGWGYVYVPGGIDHGQTYHGTVYNANGTAVQTFQNPQTWNVSGAIYILPDYVSYNNIETNKTWLLGKTNPIGLAIVEPFTNGSSVNDFWNNSEPLVANAPTYCVFNGTCLPNPLRGYVLDNLGGNSSRVNGSAYPADKTANASFNDAVFFTACFAATSLTSGNYSNIGYSKAQCGFNVTFVNTTGRCGSGSLGIWLNGSCIQPPPPPPPPRPLRAIAVK